MARKSESVKKEKSPDENVDWVLQKKLGVMLFEKKLEIELLKTKLEALEAEEALNASLNRYIETLEQNLSFQKETVQELQKRIELLTRKKEE